MENQKPEMEDLSAKELEIVFGGQLQRTGRCRGCNTLAWESDLDQSRGLCPVCNSGGKPRRNE